MLNFQAGNKLYRVFQKKGIQLEVEILKNCQNLSRSNAYYLKIQSFLLSIDMQFGYINGTIHHLIEIFLSTANFECSIQQTQISALVLAKIMKKILSKYFRPRSTGGEASRR